MHAMHFHLSLSVTACLTWIDYVIHANAGHDASITQTSRNLSCMQNDVKKKQIQT